MMNPMTIPHWYVPSFYGDIRLKALKDDQCQLIAERVTALEREALEKLAKLASKRQWLPTSASLHNGERTLKTTLNAPIDKVAAQLAKVLKPNRKVISAVKFSNGTVEELRGEADEEQANEGPYRTPAPAPVERDTPERPTPVAATTVAAPTRGCPAPDFGPAELKARGVLATFLSDEQLQDFAKYNRFISIGADTGHRYMITSRQARDQLAHYHRTLFDLETNMPLCVHDWSVPAAEEMLSLHVLLSIPLWERFLRHEEHDVELSPELWTMNV